MWTHSLIAQAIGWGTLILSSPLIFLYTRKVATYLSYRLFPRDAIIEYKKNEEIVEAYYVKHSILGKCSLRKLSKDELSRIEANQ